MKEFVRSGIKLRYPADWTIEAEDTQEGWTASIFSPATAFLVVNMIGGADDPQAIALQTRDELAKEYEKLESEAVVETIASQPAVGHDMQFFLYDLTNSAWTRVLMVPEGCLLLLAQSTDDELETNGVILEEIIASLEIED